MPRETVISFSARLEQSTNRLWGAHVKVPAATASKLQQGSSRRVRCSLEGLPERQCALVPIGNKTFVIVINKTLREKLGLAFGDRVRVTIRNDDSAYGLPMPEELDELLRQDRLARRLFIAMTPGKRRTLLHIVGSVQRPDLRLHRAVVVVRHLIANDGRINYRELYQSLRHR